MTSATGTADAAPVPAAATAAANGVTFTGHGLGHGRGMSQYGAYGYAMKGESYQWILTHFYGGTTVATMSANGGNPNETVRLLNQSGRTSVTVTSPGLSINGKPVGPYARFKLENGQITVAKATSCTSHTGSSVASLTGSGMSRAQLTSSNGRMAVCGSNTYYGSMSAAIDADTGTMEIINTVDMQHYLQGVVPSEMPASWADSFSGSGINALKAQAVAARSYARVSSNKSYAQTCDSTACQAYQGTKNMDLRSTAAVNATNGQVMAFKNKPGLNIAITEFSASSGGYSTGGGGANSTFPAVIDAGDGFAPTRNPYHNWTKTLSYSAIGAALGRPGLTSLDVTATNSTAHQTNVNPGIVLTVVATYSGGQKASYSGDQIRIRLGLNSDWFKTTPVANAGNSASPAVAGSFTAQAAETSK